jgi:glycosyltransferase involved in cell wall biosynthesis
VIEVARSVAAQWAPVWIMIDGSDDGSPEQLAKLAETLPHLRLFRFPKNRGKGSVMLEAVRQAAEEGFTHMVSFDSDGQHPADYLPRFLEMSQQHPEAMILGTPLFGKDAPFERILWREVANLWTAITTLGGGIGDALFGMRVYPVRKLKQALESTRWARRFDFEPETVARLSWLGTKAINMPTPVRYLNEEEGGVSHFRYIRDNALLTSMYLRLCFGALARLPKLICMRCRK